MKSRYDWLRENGTKVTVDGITFIVYQMKTDNDSWYCYYWKVPKAVEEKLEADITPEEKEDFHFDLERKFKGHEVTTSWYENEQYVWGWDMNHLWHKADNGYGKNAVDCDWLFRELCETAYDLTEIIG